MKEIKIIDKSGATKKTHKSGDKLSGITRINTHTIFEAVNAENQNKRQGTHETKNKAEVSGTGKKPYKQKHTGRARQGSKRNPHYRGGGVAFGPTSEKNYKVRVNKKVSKIAFVTAFCNVIESEQIAILDDSVSAIKYSTKEFFSFLKASNLVDKKILLITSMEEKELSSSARNIDNLHLRSSGNCSVRDLLNQNYLLITHKALDEMYVRMA